ncbi:MmgE/PrpD family protein [Streptomyces sp. NPDC056405]|uniref:MmgE/PrpD family protein n=1 Tax=Streptomyces sp. NPDC056405 TaxID=3345811 RepID=UPI0035DE1CF0
MRTDTTTASLAQQLAAAVTEMTWEDVPQPVRETAKAHILDALGLALAATGMDFGHAVHRAGTGLGTGEQAHALGFGTSLPTTSAALINGTLIHGLDFDDTHIGAIYHATAPALAAALAVGEEQHASGAEVLLAYVIGCEVGCRLAAAGAGKFHMRGFHPTGIIGTFAAACVAARLRGLDTDTLTSALGLCGSQAAGILELHGSWLKRMHPGWAAQAGITAVTLAEAGFRGPATVFEGRGGLYASHLGETVTADGLGLHDLGKRWMTTDIALKPYPCCHFTHAFADAARALLTDLGTDHLTAQQVDRIECPTATHLMDLVAEPADRKRAPQTIYDALFSIQYVVATTLAGRPADLATFYDHPLDDPATLALAALTTCTPDPDTDFPARFPGEVRLHLADGRTLRRKVAASHGTPDDPMTDGEIHAKYLANATRAIPEDQAHHLAALAAELDGAPDVTALVQAAAAAPEQLRKQPTPS